MLFIYLFFYKKIITHTKNRKRTKHLQANKNKKGCIFYALKKHLICLFAFLCFCLIASLYFLCFLCFLCVWNLFVNNNNKKKEFKTALITSFALLLWLTWIQHTPEFRKYSQVTATSKNSMGQALLILDRFCILLPLYGL